MLERVNIKLFDAKHIVQTPLADVFECFNVSEYFKRTVAVPMVDHVNTKLALTFDTSLTAYHGLIIIPTTFCTQREGYTKLPWK